MKPKSQSWLVGVVVLIIGVVLLVFTFICAYTFLISRFTMGGASDLPEVFGSATALLIEACLRLIYLGVMGWIGAILTSRGIRLMLESPKKEGMPEEPAPKEQE